MRTVVVGLGMFWGFFSSGFLVIVDISVPGRDFDILDLSSSLVPLLDSIFSFIVLSCLQRGAKTSRCAIWICESMQTSLLLEFSSQGTFTLDGALPIVAFD
jgi:hypothetical protein